MKTIYYEPAGRIHPSQWELINYPPEGYQFITSGTSINRVLVGNNFIFDNLRLQVLDRLMPLNLVKARLDTLTKRIPESAKLIYSYNHIIFRPIPWVVNVEWAHVLVGRDLKYLPRYKPLIEKHLSSEVCFGIFTWTEAAKRSILLNYNCQGFEHKLKVISPAIRSKNFERNYNKDKVRLLFVGSPDDPDDFALRGGQETLHTFIKLNREHTNIELTIRAKIPKRLQDSLIGLGNIRVINKTLSQDALRKEFEQADIFLFPSHKFQNTVVLEAMSYGLPIVTTEIGSSNEEYVEDNRTGLVAKSPTNIPYFVGNYILNTETIHRNQITKQLHRNTTENLTDLYNKTKALVENPELRARLGATAKQEVDYGKFSIAKRNEKLKGILDEATQ